ncbi:MAG: hypothetical protein H8E25_07800 [Planctomycetes bacterium]|nr:hypothetical protein [Planctomycetota bacterium]
MTDWLNDMLDSDAPAQVPVGFSDSVMSAISGPAIFKTRLLPLAVAASLFLALGIWIGQGSRALSTPVDVSHDAEMAAVDIDSIYANHEILDMLDLLEADSGSIDSDDDTLSVVNYAIDILNTAEVR